MDTRTILPIVLLLGGGTAGYLIYRKMTQPAPGLIPIAPGAFPPTPETEPGIKAKYGKFDIFMPTRGIADLIGSLKKGGTKQDKQVEVPVKDTAPKLGLRLPTAPSYTPASYPISGYLPPTFA